MMKQCVLFIVLLMSTLQGITQDISGIWRGHFLSGNNRLTELFGYEDRYKFELQIQQNSKKFSGVTYSYKTTVFYGKATCQGTVNTSTKKVLLEELKIVEVKMTNADACIMTCFLQYSKVGGQEFMEGTYISMNTRDSSNCGSGTIYLRKVEQSDFYKEPFIIQQENRKKQQEALAQKPPVKKADPPKTRLSTPPPAVKQPDPAPAVPKPSAPPTVKKNNADSVITPPKKILPPPPPVIRNRTNEVVDMIYADPGTITVSLYDNGAIDNDTVSVYVNNRLIVNKERLTAQPITFSLELSPENDRQEVVMVAENLGEIPPNTSLMVVRAGVQQYEVRITSTEQKNAVVVFSLKK